MNNIVKATVVAAVAAVAAVSMAACTPTEDDATDLAGKPITASAPAQKAPAKKAPSATPPTKASSASKKNPPSATKKSSTPAAPSWVKVPNGIGMDYQSAQDLWRSTGLHVLPAVDATGAHRLPLIDANWIVLSQNLKAGKKVPMDSFITATVKKYSDD
jgi:hypothetical protein